MFLTVTLSATGCQVQRTPGSRAVSAPCVQEARARIDSLHFEDGHAVLLRCLQRNDVDAHFEVARTLLVEIEWARRLIRQDASTLSVDESRAIQRERSYRGFIRRPSGSYDLVSFDARSLDVAFWILDAAAYLDYVWFVADELEAFVVSQESNPARAALAREWLEVIRPMTTGREYRPRAGREPPTEIYAREESLLLLVKAIESGRIVIRKAGVS